MMRLVILESPYNAPTQEGIDANMTYARACMLDCLNRGETPLASHVLFAQSGVLNDSIFEERQFGIRAGHSWMKAADAVVIYEDRGISAGMQQGIAYAKSIGKRIEHRKLSEPEYISGHWSRHMFDEKGGVK